MKWINDIPIEDNHNGDNSREGHGIRMEKQENMKLKQILEQ